MNNSAYVPNVHTEHTSVQNHVQHSGHVGHSSHNSTMTPTMSSYFNPHTSPVSLPAHQQSAQLQLQTMRTSGNSGTHVAANHSPISATGVSTYYDPQQVQLASALEKTFFSTAIAGLQPTAPRYYSSVGANVPPAAVSTNPMHQVSHQEHHNHQQGNTILITNNFATHQYGGPTTALTPNVSAQIQQPCTTTNVGGPTPTMTTAATSGYNNGTSNNIRIITTIPDTIHHHHQNQQQQHTIYNLPKEVEPPLRDDIIQLPQFYHAPHQTSSYAQQLASILPTHFTQHFAASSVAGGPPIQITHNDAQQQQHQFFMTMANDNDGGTAAAAATSVPKILSNSVNEVTAVNNATTTTSTMVSTPAPTATSNSTLVLDRINICINNHYSDSLATNNGLPTTTLDTNAITANSAISTAVHTLSTATHAPQQPSPIIPAIHHKVVLEEVGSSGTNPYISNDSTLVINEPDSTTTTPHTPPTTPENSSPPPPTQPNLTSTRTIATTQQVITAQIIIEDKVLNDKENYVAPQIVCIPAIKPLAAKVMDKAETNTTAHAITAITQSIDLVDEDEEECDYGSSVAENDHDTEKDITPNTTNDDNIMEICDDDDAALSAPETIRMKNNIQSAELDTEIVATQQQGFAGLSDTSIENESNILKVDSPKSPTITKTLQIAADETASSVTLLTPPTPTTSPPQNIQGGLKNQTTVASTGVLLPDIVFSMGEDVFIRKDDGRQYLGTVIGSSAGGERNTINKIQYLIRFDDNSELWCCTEQMRRLGSNSGNGNAQMCVACKRTQLEEIVEICDDCRRGYHRSCTKETLPGSGVWWCLRCNKPMKDPPQSADCKMMGKLLSNSKNSYKNYGEIFKSSPSSTKHKTPADIYEFHTDNEVFTSDDEIPIKHIMEKVRKVRDLTENNNSGIRLKSTKKQNNPEILCEITLNSDDENANDANVVNTDVQTPEKEKVKVQNISLNDDETVVSVKCPTNIENDASAADGQLTTAAAGTVESNATESAYIKKAPSIAADRTSRKRKAFTLSNTYKEVAAEAASKRYDSSRVCDSSSDENSSSSRGTSLDVIIPAPKNFLGLNNPFRMVTPKKSSPPSLASGMMTGGCVQSLFSFSRSGTMIKNSIFNTTALDFSSKLAALKSAGIFPNLSTSNLVKAAGQPRTVRTIKRRLSAKDITIGPNQEVRRRRTRRLSSNVEVISTTTFNTIPTNFFPIHAKDLLSKHTHLNAPTSTSRILSTFSKQKQQKQSALQHQQSAPTCTSSLSSASSASSSPPGSVASSVDSHVEVVPIIKPSHGRRLRQRPQKNSPANSRRSSISSGSTGSSNNSSSNMTLAKLQQQQALHNNNSSKSNVNTDGTSIQDLKQSVKQYFGGVINRIESGEQFSIRAKRQLANGQMQYLIEWGDANVVSNQTQTILSVINSTEPPPTTTTATLKNDE